MNEIQNEKIKFLAATIDRAGTAFIASGVLGPFFAAMGNPNMDDRHIPQIILGSIFCIFCAFALHWRAFELMKALVPE